MKKTLKMHQSAHRVYLDISEQKQPVGRNETRHQRRQRVIVAKSKLVDRHRVVLIHDRHNAEIQQAQKRVLRVAVCEKSMGIRNIHEEQLNRQ